MSPGPGPGRRSRWGPPWAGSGERPPWWPADESWPPAGGRRRRRGFGCLFSAVFLLGVLGVLAIATSLVGALLGGTRSVRPSDPVRRNAGGDRPGGRRGPRRPGRSAAPGACSTTSWTRRPGSRPGTTRRASTSWVRLQRPVRALTRGFNTMAARLEADEAQRRSLLADVTPRAADAADRHRRATWRRSWTASTRRTMPIWERSSTRPVC